LSQEGKPVDECSIEGDVARPRIGTRAADLTVISATGRVSAGERARETMRFYSVSDRDGKKQVNWLSLLIFVPSAYAAVVAAAEGFWYFFTGGFSPLVGGFGGVVATLVVIRVVGECLVAPAVAARTRGSLVETRTGSFHKVVLGRGTRRPAVR
jgi:hypothetical protein